MIDGFKLYPAMKDSGVPWLGEVPEHWRLPRIGALLRERGETNADSRVTDVLSVTRDRGVIPYAEKGNIGNKKSDDITRYKIVRPDDIVVNCMNVIIGSVGLSRYTGCLSPVYYVLTRRSQHDDPRYLNAYFQTRQFQESLVRIGNGILAHRMRIPMELLKNELCPRPPACEQADIARFLDHADRRILRYIRAKQKLIKLLEEQKQAIIHRAVTQSLDPSVRLKASGVEWVGDVPEHWEVRRLKYVCDSIQMGPFGASLKELQSYDTGYKLFGQENTISGDFNKGQRWITDEQFESLRRYELQPGDLILTRKGSIGKCKMVPAGVSKGIADSDTIRIRVDHHQLIDEFLVLLLHDAAYIGRQIASVQRGAILAGLNTATIGNLWLAIPPLTEQQSLIARLALDTAAVTRTMAAAQYEDGLLREYQTRLIADVVTGKLDVRDAAAQLPDEVEEPEPFDEVEAESDADAIEAGDGDELPEETEA
jgi:type I restriction enzyme S subunit